MRLDYQLEMQQAQKLVITPQLQMALKLLQLPAVELQTYLVQQYLENPLLELAEEGVGQEEALSPEDMGKAEPDWDYDAGEREDRAPGEPRKEVTFENFLAGTVTLQQALIQQLRLLSLPNQQRRIAENILGNLNEDGYLSLSCKDIARQLQVKTPAVTAALKVVQSLDPVGIGARDLRECLLLQIDCRRDEPPFAREIISNHLPLVAKGRIPALAGILGADTAQVQQAIDYIRNLEPRPGASLGAGTSSPSILADVTLLDVNGDWVILVNDSPSHRLRLSQGYQKMLALAEPQIQKYLRGKLNSALWLLRAIEQRRTTLYRITVCILERQGAFFHEGAQGLSPLRLKDVGLALDIHESTVSRAIQGKHLQTPRGVFSYKYFFSSQLSTLTGKSVASTGVKEMLSTIVAQEDKEEPLADQQITELLAERGIEISRRTVAKYREQLGIPGSILRKRWQ